MNQMEIGNFIAKRRKEKNLTQAGLAEKLNVSNKTISKWETGKCMPDYNVIQSLCDELGITISELMDAEESEPSSIRTYDEEQILDLIKRTQNLESQKTSLYGVILFVMGIAFFVLHSQIGGSTIKDFLSGLLMGISIAMLLAGFITTLCGLAKQKK